MCGSVRWGSFLPVDVTEYTPTREEYVYTRCGAHPGHAHQAGGSAATVVRRRIRWRSVDEVSSAKVDLRFVNPQTGPFYVEGAEPGGPLSFTWSRSSRRATGAHRRPSRSLVT